MSHITCFTTSWLTKYSKFVHSVLILYSRCNAGHHQIHLWFWSVRESAGCFLPQVHKGEGQITGIGRMVREHTEWNGERSIGGSRRQNIGHARMATENGQPSFEDQPCRILGTFATRHLIYIRNVSDTTVDLFGWTFALESSLKKKLNSITICVRRRSSYRKASYE